MDLNGGHDQLQGEVTERQRVEHELLVERNFISTILDTVSALVVIFDRHGRIIRLNRACEEITGYSFDEVRGKYIWDLFLLPEEVEPVKAVFAKLQAGQFPNQHENYWVARNGSRRLIAWSNTVILDADSSVEYIIGTGTDITERRRVEEALQESQRSLSALMKSLPGLAYRGRPDKDRAMTFVSEGCFELTGYRNIDLIENRTISYGQLIHPDDRETIWADIQTALQERRPFRFIYRISTVTGEEKWVWEQGRGVFSSQGELLAIEGLITDITERILARHMLEQHVEERTQELTTLLAVQQAITSHLDSRVALQLIADSARRLTATRLSIVYLLNGDDLYVSVLSGEYDPELFVGYRIPVAESVAGLAIRSGQPFTVNNAQHDPRIYSDIIRRLKIRSYLAVPLISVSKPVGAIAVADKLDGKLGSDEERILTMLAPGAVIGLENAHLYQREQERRQEAEERHRVAENLRDILAVLNSNRPLDDILDYIAIQTTQLLGSDADAIYRLQSDKGLLTIQAARGLGDDYITEVDIHPGHTPVGQAVLTRRPVAVANISDLLTDDSNLKLDKHHRNFLEKLAIYYRAILAVPLIVKDDVYGGIVLYYREPRTFSDEEVALAVTYSDQVALAIENARLRAQAEQIAVAAERNRLAHDLHDSVTQAIFSATLVAEVLPHIWQRNPDEAQQSLVDLRQLTRGALAEMRTLLLELRPAALIEAKLDDLLRQLTEAITGRAQILVELTLEDIPTLPSDVQVALYRIAQEALNNVVKHAEASQVTVSLHTSPPLSPDVESPWEGMVILRISDDGRGFNPKTVSSDHLGLDIMHERAEAIGATLNIRSQSDQGTQITAIWQAGIADE